jgi:hypothetical protein
MSAREQAREAAVNSPLKNYSTGLSHSQWAKKTGADAASDVWEPILRELAFVAQQGEFVVDDSAIFERFEAALAKAWEALG